MFMYNTKFHVLSDMADMYVLSDTVRLVSVLHNSYALNVWVVTKALLKPELSFVNLISVCIKFCFPITAGGIAGSSGSRI